MRKTEVRIDIAEAFYTAACATTGPQAEAHTQLLAAVASHDRRPAPSIANPVQHALDGLGNGVFWVRPPGSVTLEARWPL